MIPIRILIGAMAGAVFKRVGAKVKASKKAKAMDPIRAEVVVLEILLLHGPTWWIMLGILAMFILLVLTLKGRIGVLQVLVAAIVNGFQMLQGQRTRCPSSLACKSSKSLACLCT